MIKPITYVKQELAKGVFPMMTIEAGEFGSFWLHDRDYKMLDCKPFKSRIAAEKYRSKILDKAQKSA